MASIKDRIPLQISKGVIIVPIRNEITHWLLDNLRLDLQTYLVEHNAYAAIFDLKGVEILDAQDVKDLSQIIQMVRLMGFKVVLCGLSAGVVSAMVEMDVQFKNIVTVFDLNAAFEFLEK